MIDNEHSSQAGEHDRIEKDAPEPDGSLSASNKKRRGQAERLTLLCFGFLCDRDVGGN